MTQKMRAWQVTGTGEPADVLHLVDVDVPEPGPGQARIRVTAAGIGLPGRADVPGHLPADAPAPVHPRPGGDRHRHRGGRGGRPGDRRNRSWA